MQATQGWLGCGFLLVLVGILWLAQSCNPDEPFRSSRLVSPPTTPARTTTPSYPGQYPYGGQLTTPAWMAPTSATANPNPEPNAEPRPQPQPNPEPEPEQERDEPTDVYYRNCDEARAAGAAPIYAGEPGYRGALDRNKNGVACE
jgi:hypothetical protein